MDEGARQAQKPRLFQAFCLPPPGFQAKSPAIILLHDNRGLSRFMQWQVERVSEALHVIAAAPDFADGELPNDEKAASALDQRIRPTDAVRTVEQLAGTLRADSRCNGKIALVGFGVGGEVALLASSVLADIAASVSYYGVPRSPVSTWASRCDALLHMVPNDSLISSDLLATLTARVAAAENTLTVHTYENAIPPLRGFADDSRPNYHPTVAREAWRNTAVFLQSRLGIDNDGATKRNVVDPIVARYIA